MALGLLGAFSAHAQEINIGQAVARKISDDKVEVSFNMDCSTLRLPSRRQMIITPLIISRSENDTLALPSVCIAGRNRYRMNKRKESLYGKEPAAGEGQEMIRFNRKRDMLLEYNETVPAQEWMSGARVEIFRELQGCAGCGEALGNAPVAELPLFKEEVERPNLQIMVAQAEEKRRSFTRSAYLNFKVNQSVLLADYMNNPAELAKIYSSIDSIREDDNYRIARIKIVGYSSPEGNYDANARLSEQRAIALVQNLKHAYKLDGSMIECRSVPENWEGLAAWLREYRPSYMQKVLDIIGQIPEPDARDAKVKAIDGGKIYNALLREVYPKLRLVEYTVSYTVVPFSVEQGREIIKTRPDKMNHNEMYQVAVSYGKGSDEYNRIIRMIADRFPSDRIANNNAAIVAWEMGDYDAMQVYLKRLEGIKAE
jgi:outer membrane protein OmpA-like peptidoglycan-associated protein